MKKHKTVDLSIGVHVSISDSLSNSIDNAIAVGCNTFQIFTRSPRNWHAPPLLKKEVNDFLKKIQSTNFDKSSITAHMPYLPNFSSPEKVSFRKSMKSLIEESKRCSKLGIPYLVAHLGSHKGVGSKKGVETVVNAFKKAADVTPDDVMILLENNVGHKYSVGSKFEEFAEIFSQLEPLKRFGICFDTCHAFAVGYELRSTKSASKTFSQFIDLIGKENLKLIHLNDSRGPIGCNVDVHEHIGLGHIGKDGLSYFVKFAKSNKVPVILETPIDERRDDMENIKIVQEIANGKK